MNKDTNDKALHDADQADLRIDAASAGGWLTFLQAEQNHEALSSPRLVVAIDYGDTSTAIAYTICRTASIKLRDVQLVDDWGIRMGNRWRVSNDLSYTPASNGEEQCGHDISLDAVTIVNTKYDLDIPKHKLDELNLILDILNATEGLSFNHVKKSGIYPDYAWKTPEDIVKDYFSRLTRHVLRSIEPYIELAKTVDLVVTVPSKWSYRGRNSLFRALQAAGLSPQQFGRSGDVILVTEEEATSLFFSNYMHDLGLDFLKVSEIFVLCIADNDRIETVGYQVKQLKPLELRQSTSKTGAELKFRAQFQRWLRHALGEEHYRIIDPQSTAQRIGGHSMETPQMRSIIRSFEAHRDNFSRESSTIRIDLPKPLDRLNIPGRVRDGELYLNVDEMMKIINPYVDSLVEMIQGQVQQIERKLRRVKNVFLVGNCGSLPYVQGELRLSMSYRKINLRHLPQNQWATAIVKGATVHGVEKKAGEDLKLAYPCPRSFAILVNDVIPLGSFDQTEFKNSSASLKHLARPRLRWVIRKDDLILSNEKRIEELEFGYVFSDKGERLLRLPVFVYPYDDDDVPESWEAGQSEIEEVGVVRCDISKLPLYNFDRKLDLDTGQAYYAANLTCKMSMSIDELQIEVFLSDKMIGRTAVMVREGESGSETNIPEERELGLPPHVQVDKNAESPHVTETTEAVTSQTDDATFSAIDIATFYDKLMALLTQASKFDGCGECLTPSTKSQVHASFSLLYLWSQGHDLREMEKALKQERDLLRIVADLLGKIAEIINSDLFSIDSPDTKLDIGELLAYYGFEQDDNSESSDTVWTSDIENEATASGIDAQEVHTTHKYLLRQLDNHVASLMSLLPTLKHVVNAGHSTARKATKPK